MNKEQLRVLFIEVAELARVYRFDNAEDWFKDRDSWIATRLDALDDGEVQVFEPREQAFDTEHIICKHCGKPKDDHIHYKLCVIGSPVKVDDGEGEAGKLIARLVELKPYHMMPYNLGDMGEMGQIIDKLQKLIPSLPEPHKP